MARLATENQKKKLKLMGFDFKDSITMEEAREILAADLPEVPMKSNISQRPEIFDSIMVRSEVVVPKYTDNDNVRFLT